MLDQQLKDQLLELYGKELPSLPTAEQFHLYLKAFRERFSPDRLASLEGEALLETMHSHGSKESLVYWLEFKNDTEFPSTLFGSIAGGSAFKFGIYKSSETGEWKAGSAKAQVTISVREAITRAEAHREQLLRGVRLLEKLPAEASEQEYRKLQQEINGQAPDVSELAWGHKYFFLLFPDKLDDFHNVDYQRFHLWKLQIPVPVEAGRYELAFWYTAVARELGISTNSLTWLLNARNGKPHSYWRIGTREGDSKTSHWEAMKSGGFGAVGWKELGDLSWVSYNDQSKKNLQSAIAEKYQQTPQQTGKDTQQLFSFVARVSEGDILIAADGEKVLGIGKVVGGYSFSGDHPFPHRRKVEWLNTDEWKPAKMDGLRTTVYRVKTPELIVSIEKHLQLPASPRVRRAGKTRGSNIIYYGPPGTGKTFQMQQLFAEYTDAAVPESRGEFLEKLVSPLPWWQVVALVLLHVKSARVPEIYAHEILQAKDRQMAQKNARAMIWAMLQQHTVEGCAHVKYEKRYEPFLFSKDAESVWTVDEEAVGREVPELFDLKEKIRNFNPRTEEVRRYEFVTFHQSYGYEDFVEGIRPLMDKDEEAEVVRYRVEPGVFRRICNKAEKDPANGYAIFIDEINRGNISKIFGELITLIERDKRVTPDGKGLRARLPYSKDDFGVPENLSIIGTMNTADRSIAFIDIALRRRFLFSEMMPNLDLITQMVGNQGVIDNVDIRQLLDTMNRRIEFLYDRDHMIGHSFFLPCATLEDVRDAFLQNIIPLLQEYFYGDWEKICLVLGCGGSVNGSKTVNEHPVIRSDRLIEKDILGFDHLDFEDCCRFEVCPGFSGADGDLLKKYLTGIYSKNGGTGMQDQ